MSPEIWTLFAFAIAATYALGVYLKIRRMK